MDYRAQEKRVNDFEAAFALLFAHGDYPSVEYAESLGHKVFSPGPAYAHVHLVRLGGYDYRIG